jgi:hypothetical protein
LCELLNSIPRLEITQALPYAAACSTLQATLIDKQNFDFQYAALTLATESFLLWMTQKYPKQRPAHALQLWRFYL